MTPKGPSAKYVARARALTEAMDLAVELYAALPAYERDSMVEFARERKGMVLTLEPPFANLRSLAYLEDEFFTNLNEAGGEHVERFWQLVVERSLPFQRKDVVRTVLTRGRINSDSEYQTITDSLVIQQQIGTISPAEADRLSRMLGQFEKRSVARR